VIVGTAQQRAADDPGREDGAAVMVVAVMMVMMPPARLGRPAGNGQGKCEKPGNSNLTHRSGLL
jgi:hypothetical protein